MSNSACLNGAATLFLTTLTRTRLPTASVPSLSVSIRRMSSRWEAVELQRPAAGLGLRRAEHHADLLADLVGEHAQRLGAVEVAGQLAHRLGHHPRLRADGLVAHLALELRARRQRRHRVDRDQVDRAGADQHVDDLERLLAVVGLGDEQLVDVDADLLRVQRVHRVLGVDERAHPAELLGLGDDVVDERRLTRGLRAEDLDDPAARHAADPERDVQRQRAGGDRVARSRARRGRPCASRSPCRTAARSESGRPGGRPDAWRRPWGQTRRRLRLSRSHSCSFRLLVSAR